MKKLLSKEHIREEHIGRHGEHTLDTSKHVLQQKGIAYDYLFIVLSVAKRQRPLPSLDSCSPFVSLL